MEKKKMTSEGDRIYREYVDKKYLQLSQLKSEDKLTKKELNPLNPRSFSIRGLEILVVRLPFHPDTFVFKKEEDNNYYKW